jgi:hypothetical protein
MSLEWVFTTAVAPHATAATPPSAQSQRQTCLGPALKDPLDVAGAEYQNLRIFLAHHLHRAPRVQPKCRQLAEDGPCEAAPMWRPQHKKAPGERADAAEGAHRIMKGAAFGMMRCAVR